MQDWDWLNKENCALIPHMYLELIKNSSWNLKLFKWSLILIYNQNYFCSEEGINVAISNIRKIVSNTFTKTIKIKPEIEFDGVFLFGFYDCHLLRT